MQPIRNHCKEPSTPSTLTQQCWAYHYRAKDSVPRRVRTSALLCCCGKIKKAGPLLTLLRNFFVADYFTVLNVKLPTRKLLLDRHISTRYCAGVFCVWKLVWYSCAVRSIL